MTRQEFISYVTNGITKCPDSSEVPFVSPLIASAIHFSSYGTTKAAKEFNNPWGLTADDLPGADCELVRGVPYVTFETFDKACTAVCLWAILWHGVKVEQTPYGMAKVLYGDETADKVMLYATKHNLYQYDVKQVQPTRLDYSRVVSDILLGKYGRGGECKQRVSALGYNYRRVMSMLRERRRNAL